MNQQFSAKFYEGGIFHVYNRTNNKEPLFKSDENRRYFLKLYSKYLAPFLDSFCWCLLPNHFHFLVRVKSNDVIKAHLQNIPANLLKVPEKEYLADNATAEQLIRFEWKRFFTAYAMAFNEDHSRKGNLFQRPFKRVEVIKDSHFTQTIVYIHANSFRHKIAKDFTLYPWSSWHTMLSAQPTQLCRNEVLDWFGGLQAFIETHLGMSEYYFGDNLCIEEED